MLVNSLTISIAAGMDWLRLNVDQGCVLFIDNELHQNTTTYRFMEVTKALNLPSHLFSDQLRVRSLRGDLKDMNQLGEIFSRIKPGRYRVIVIDAFYRTMPDGTDENDNGAIAALYNKLDRYALQLKCEFILIHHTSKGNQAAKSVTDVGAGAGAQSRAADTHVILRAHEEKDKVVMDAATRSWPPLDTLVLAKQHPLFVIDDDADPTALLGAVKTGQSKPAMGLEEFVESCIASQDPCIYSEIVRVASGQHGLSKRQVRQLIDEAIEEELIMRLNAASSIRYVKIREGFSGEKGQWVAALLARNPNAEAAQLLLLPVHRSGMCEWSRAEMKRKWPEPISASFPKKFFIYKDLRCGTGETWNAFQKAFQFREMENCNFRKEKDLDAKQCGTGSGTGTLSP